jgi:hypothetical protein
MPSIEARLHGSEDGREIQRQLDSLLQALDETQELTILKTFQTSLES